MLNLFIVAICYFSCLLTDGEIYLFILQLISESQKIIVKFHDSCGENIKGLT